VFTAGIAPGTPFKVYGPKVEGFVKFVAFFKAIAESRIVVTGVGVVTVGVGVGVVSVGVGVGVVTAGGWLELRF
jgi:hypothetical protein